MAPKLPNLPCFQAYWVIFCPDVCSYFCLVCGGRGSPAYFGISQTCLGANVLSGLVPSTVFKKNLWAFLGPCVRGRGRPWYGTSAQPESHFTCSSARGAPRVVPSTSLLNYFWAFLVALGRGEGAPLVRYLCKTQKSLHGRHV